MVHSVLHLTLCKMGNAGGGADNGDVTIGDGQPSNWEAAFSKIGSCSVQNGFHDMYCILPD